jgi:hypothetical protein
LVSAITQTPASGPFALETTPPMSLVSMLTAAFVFCCPLSRTGKAVKSSAILATTMPAYNSLFMLIPFSLVSFRPLTGEIKSPPDQRATADLPSPT